jgi:hypothetical protein
MSTPTERLDLMRAAGRRAYHRPGAMRAPDADPECMALLATWKLAVGEGVPVLRAWCAGWDAAAESACAEVLAADLMDSLMVTETWVPGRPDARRQPPDALF